MTLMHAWHEFSNSVTVQLGRLCSQPFTNSHFHFLIAVVAALAPPTNGLARGVILQHDITIPHSTRTHDSFSNSVQWVLLTCRLNSTCDCYKASTKHSKETVQYTKTKHCKQDKTKTIWQENNSINGVLGQNPKPLENIR